MNEPPLRAARIAAAAFVLSLAGVACSTNDSDEGSDPVVADAAQADAGAGEEQAAFAPPEGWSYERWLSSGGAYAASGEADKLETRSREEWQALLAAPVIAKGAEADARFVHDLWAVANLYPMWARVDNEAAWAPFLCRLPMPGSGRLSEASGTKQHARKLYYLYARERENYLKLTEDVGVAERQAVVKRAFTPKALDDACSAIAARYNQGAATVPSAERTRLQAQYGSEDFVHLPPLVDDDGQGFVPGQAAGLFVMFRPEHDANATDEGWVYGTLNRAGEITACGQIESCMGCHADALHERLFGLDY